jgi:hypothetical protein
MQSENIENPHEQESLLADEMSEIRAIEMEGYEIGVRKARNTLFAVAGLLFVSELINLYSSGLSLSDLTGLGWLIIIGEILVFVGLALWTKTKPYTAILIGLILFIGLIALSAFVDINTIYKGIIVKAIVIIYLIKSLNDAKSLEAAKKEQ